MEERLLNHCYTDTLDVVEWFNLVWRYINNMNPTYFIYDQTIPTVGHIETIAAINEPVLRNLQITQCYSEISMAFARWGGYRANWCSFATWASKQAGQTIRKEDLKGTLRMLIQKDPEIGHMLSMIATLAKAAGASASLEQLKKSTAGLLVSTAVTRASEAVSRGNKKVFEEIAPVFIRFLMTCGDDESFIQAHIDDLCNDLRPGDPPGGQGYLDKAFRNYYKAKFETDLIIKAELYLLANLQIGFHEQTRLQPEIAESLHAVLPDMGKLKTRILDELFAGTGFWKQAQIFLYLLTGRHNRLKQWVDELIKKAQQPVHRLLTIHLMTLTIPPQKILRLGQDLQANYPGCLQRLTNPELLALLKRIDPTPDSVLGTGTTDWADLHDRLHFITDLFRCYQEMKDLFDPPFTPAQVAELKKGNIPSGNL